jgi:hypothetical protein
MLDCTGAHSFAADPGVDRALKPRRESCRCASTHGKIDVRYEAHFGHAESLTKSGHQGKTRRLEREADYCASAGILPVETIT